MRWYWVYPVSGRSADLDNSRAFPTSLAVGTGGLVWTFVSRLSLLSPSLWETARYSWLVCWLIWA